MRSVRLRAHVPVRRCREDLQVRPVVQVWAELRLRMLNETGGETPLLAAAEAGAAKLNVDWT